MTSGPVPKKDALVALPFPVSAWHLIDGTLDNSVSVAIWGADGTDESARTAEWGAHVREAGWAAARAHPRRDSGTLGWPPSDEVLTVSVSRGRWEFVVRELRRWAEVDESTGGDGTELRELAAELASRPQLAPGVPRDT